MMRGSLLDSVPITLQMLCYCGMAVIRAEVPLRTPQIHGAPNTPNPWTILTSPVFRPSQPVYSTADTMEQLF